MQRFAVVAVLSLMSLRNLLSHKWKSVIVGSIMLFGTFLVVLGTALLDSIDKSMAKSITGSLAGHLQAYDAKARDELAIFGGTSPRKPDNGRILDFAKVKSALEAVPEVEAVIPMGIDWSVVTNPGETDRTLAALRDAVHAGDREKMTTLGKRVRQLAAMIEEELDKTAEISSDEAKIARGRVALARAKSDELWAEFERDPLGVLEFLDTEVAPLSEDGKLIWLRYVGTDIHAFAENFDRFEIVDGEMVPTGERGFLFNKKTYEDYIKNRVATELDFLRRNVVEQGKTFAQDPILEAKARQLPRQYRRVTYQLDVDETAKLEQELRERFPDTDGGLEELMKAFLTVDEANIAERHAAFYELIAPMIQLYDVPIGETLTLRGMTKSGYMSAVNVKVYGTFRFKGMERSELAGGHNLVDMMTFRDLFGFMTEERKKEIEQIRGAAGSRAVDRASAEDALFGGAGDALVETRKEGEGFDEFEGADLANVRARAEEEAAAKFDQADIDGGVAINAAIILDDPDRLLEGKAAVEQALAAAGLDLKVVDWGTASGIIGQFMLLLRAVLFIAIAIIFTVALVIINNSMITATMERVTEIGTMRAIGAQRRFVLVMFLLETIVLGMIAGTLGAALGAGTIELLGQTGIGATTDVQVFLFAGPRLYPEFGVHNLVIGFVAILIVSIASTLYPARIATRIQPIVAMQRKE